MAVAVVGALIQVGQEERAALVVVAQVVELRQRQARLTPEEAAAVADTAEPNTAVLVDQA
jgi:hypothetical protein